MEILLNLLEQAKSGALILTPNRRLSAWITSYYNQKQNKDGLTTWQSPQILPYNSWISSLWDEYSYSSLDNNAPILLSPAQETYLWEAIVTKSEASNHLLQVSAAADLAQSAFNMLCQWNLSADHPVFDTSEDSKTFKAWATEFIRLCTHNNWISNSQLQHKLNELISTHRIHTPTNILLYGFTELTPAMLTLKALLETQNVDFHCYAINDSQNTPSRARFETPDKEIIATARWAKHLFRNNPEQTIGIVIPNLDTSRSRVKQIYNDVFNHTDDFNITAGLPLAKFPVIKVALELLKLNKSTIPQLAFSSLLSTPFCGDAESERIKRANLDARIRQDNIDTIRLSDLSDSTSNLSALVSKSSHKLHKRLLAWLDNQAITHQRHSYQAWQKIFNDQLHILGWPGERSLNSAEYQVVDKWFELLIEFAKLDYVAAPASLATALSSLCKLANNQSFQPKTPTANIQVMGLLEAASIPFDHLWITGMNDAEWPQQPSPNPFIPLRLQREMNMPHATSQRELDYCQQVTNQFMQTTKNCIFSFAEKLDKIEVAASPLIRRFPDVSHIDYADFTPVNQSLIHATELESIIDNNAPSVQPEDKMNGGIAIIKDQALCPFKSFATWRLHARELEEPLPGFRKKDRGTITHKILEKLWQKIINSDSLHQLSSNDLDLYINDIVTSVFADSRYTKPQQPEFLKLEKSRLIALVKAWLEVERKRPPFSVHQQEVEVPIQLGSLRLNARIDRIDKLADGNHLIIDYKTSSSVDPKKWFGERPEEPQLPIYALHDSKTCGIAFAQVYTGDCSFNGIAKDDLGIEGIKVNDWNAQMIEWRHEINQLADQFHQGLALPDPKSGRDTCQRCSLQPLCRIHQENNDD